VQRRWVGPADFTRKRLALDAGLSRGDPPERERGTWLTRPAGRIGEGVTQNPGSRTEGCARDALGSGQGNAAPGLLAGAGSPPTFLVRGLQELLNRCAMRHELTAETLARLILWGLDQAMAGQPRPLRLRSALVAALD